MMPMCYINQFFIVGQQCIFGHNRELKNHLVDLCFTVPSNTQDLGRMFIQQRNNSFRIVFFRKIVTRPMI